MLQAKVSQWGDSYDVVVLGAGPAGLAALSECAAAGVDVLMLEQEGFAGGALAAGLCSLAGLRVSDCRASGLEQDFIRGLRERGGLVAGEPMLEIVGHKADAQGDSPGRESGYFVVPEAAKQVTLELITARDATLLHHVQCTSIHKEGDWLSVRVAMKEGLRRVRGRVVVDTTGATGVASIRSAARVTLIAGAIVSVEEPPRGGTLHVDLAGLEGIDGSDLGTVKGVVYSLFGHDRLVHLSVVGEVSITNRWDRGGISRYARCQFLGARILHRVLHAWKDRHGGGPELLSASPYVFVEDSRLGGEGGTERFMSALGTVRETAPRAGPIHREGAQEPIGESFPASVWTDTRAGRSPFGALETVQLPYRALLGSLPGLLYAGGSLLARHGVSCRAFPVSFAFDSGQAAGRLAVRCLKDGPEKVWGASSD